MLGYPSVYKIRNMKVYISQPIDKMSPIEIETSRAYAINELKKFGHEVIDDYTRDERGYDAESQLVALADDLKHIAEADAVYFIDDWENSRRCQAEHALCEIYGIKVYNSREFY